MNDKKGFAFLPPELRKLIERCFDEPLDESEVAQLEQALAENADAREMYEDLAQLHAALSSQLQTSAFCKKVVNRELRESSKPLAPTLDAVPKRFHLSKYLARAVSALPVRSAAAVLALGIGLGCGVGILAAVIVHTPPQFFAMPWEWSVPDDIVAKIESTHEVVWQVSEIPETPPTRGLRVGQELRIDRGLLQIVYRNGVGVILEGPTVYEIRSELGGKLFAGRLSAVVPSDCSAFHVETQIGRLDIGPGHFGVDAEHSAAKREVSVSAVSGYAAGVTSARFVTNSGSEVELAVGDSIQIDSDGVISTVRLPERDEYPFHMPPPRRERFAEQTIYLGNLFDDCKTASLTEAMQSDRYQAAAETIDLGIAAVHDGGLDLDVSLAEDGVLFNFSNVGGGGTAVLGLPGNDTYRSSLPIPIRTTGNDLPYRTTVDHHALEGPGPVAKIEEGIGISSNELLTFDLNELRKAGELDSRAMRFVSDRAGINDRELPLETSRTVALANLVVIVSTENQVLSAYLNGQVADVVKHTSVYSLNVDEARACRGLRYDGRFVEFDVPIPAEARFLTLVSTSLGVDWHDHVVFSGARLEIEPTDRNEGR